MYSIIMKTKNKMAARTLFFFLPHLLEENFNEADDHGGANTERQHDENSSNVLQVKLLLL